MLTLAAVVLSAAFAQPAPSGQLVPPSELAKLPPHEQDRFTVRDALGWVNLGHKSAWRGYKQKDFPSKGWSVDNGISSSASGGGGDIMTRDQFGDFELEFLFKCEPKANSGVIYRSTEKHGASWQTGPEFQVLDDAGHGLKPGDPHSVGAMYELVSPAEDKVYKANNWNTGRIYIRNGMFQHWLNDKKVAQIVAFD
ncbi:MAG: DUF1080 domain-containing protein, partial [Phycisphaerales bacterium]|nr:DUF1080 domain-containing protein [Phycisphaerales bacterium]